jgi:hypothetical protein
MMSATKGTLSRPEAAARAKSVVAATREGVNGRIATADGVRERAKRDPEKVRIPFDALAPAVNEAPARAQVLRERKADVRVVDAEVAREPPLPHEHRRERRDGERAEGDARTRPPEGRLHRPRRGVPAARPGRRRAERGFGRSAREARASLCTRARRRDTAWLP